MGNLYIDGQDAYSLYRVFATGGEYGGLASYPALKSVESNDWAEEDGLECDLSVPALDTREFSAGFSFHNDSSLGAFIEALSDGAYHDLSFVEAGRTCRLRLVSQGSLSQTSTLGTFALRFADDFPLSGYSYVAPQSNIVPLCGYKLDGRRLSEYGVHVLKGGYTEIQKAPAVKKNLLRNINRLNGAIYDGERVRFQTKDVRLSCLMRAAGMQDFWRNHDALLYDLTRPGERVLYADSTGYEYPCVYKSCSAGRFATEGKIWFEFGIVLTFVSFHADTVSNFNLMMI
jgi:hypothetical protein